MVGRNYFVWYGFAGVFGVVGREDTWVLML